MDSGPSTPLPDKKLLVFILDRLQKCVFLALLSVYLTLCVVPFYLIFNFLGALISGRTSMVCFPNQWTPMRLVLGVMTQSAFGFHDIALSYPYIDFTFEIINCSFQTITKL